MPVGVELLTLSEAAVVADVTVRDVNRAIDEHILPENLYSLEGGRWLKSSACTYVRFYFHMAKRLTADERTQTIAIVAGMKRRPKSWNIESDGLTVHFERFVTETETRHAALVRAREMVVEDPEILDGTPVLKGTRVPVYDVAAAVTSGETMSRIRAAYPTIEAEQIGLAKLYADANPRRGRPRRMDARPLDLTVLSDQKGPRRRRGYDNERGKGDHRHSGKLGEAYPFTSVDQLVADFEADVAIVRGATR